MVMVDSVGGCLPSSNDKQFAIKVPIEILCEFSHEKNGVFPCLCKRLPEGKKINHQE